METKCVAQIILTGYDKLKIEKSMKQIWTHSRKVDLKVIEDKKMIKSRTKLWGTDEGKVMEKFLILEGSMPALTSILNIGIEDGIYLEMLKR